MVKWFYCFESSGKQKTAAECVARDDCSSHGGQEVETEKGNGSQCLLKGASSVASLPPSRFHLPNAANLPRVP